MGRDFKLRMAQNGLEPAAFVQQLAYENGYFFSDAFSVTPAERLHNTKPFTKLENALLIFGEASDRGIKEIYQHNTGYVFMTRAISKRIDPIDLDKYGLPYAYDTPYDYDEDFSKPTKTADNSIDINYNIVYINFYFNSVEECEEYKKYLINNKEPISVKEDQTQVTFWYQTSNGPTNYSLKIDTPSWEEIKNNYPRSLQTNLTSLINYDLDHREGSIILLHGPAGTGKTYFIRSLIREWKKTVQPNYIIDVDQLFSKESADYLVRMTCQHENTGKYNLILMEDSGELLAKDAKLMMGQAMSRMLNLSDGILGQGGKTILLISTNEEVGSLNEAIRRPGRCFANINFNNFSAEEANIWLKNHNQVVTGEKSLAELYEMTYGKLITNKSSKRIGFN